MYILVKASVPSYYVPVVCAHASLACYLKYKDDVDMQIWANSIFRKVDKNLVITESGLDNMEVAIALAPREEFPKFIKFLKLYSFDD